MSSFKILQDILTHEGHDEGRGVSSQYSDVISGLNSFKIYAQRFKSIRSRLGFKLEFDTKFVFERSRLSLEYVASGSYKIRIDNSTFTYTSDVETVVNDLVIFYRSGMRPNNSVKSKQAYH